MLAEQTDFVNGVDTHRDRHSAAILTSSGGLVDETSASADRRGYAKLLRWAQSRSLQLPPTSRARQSRPTGVL
jgi:transposase